MGRKFSSLSKQAKQHAIEQHRSWNAYGEWWDHIYEDAKRMGALMGIEVRDIRFSDFWCQGDGASYEGRYTPKADAIEAVKAEAGQDEELHRIARELTVLAVESKMVTGETWGFTIHRIDSRYSHEMTMQTGYADDDVPEEHQAFMACHDLKVQDVLRDFARWIYVQLEAEYGYLTSDEAISEMLAESHLRFDEHGETI